MVKTIAQDQPVNRVVQATTSPAEMLEEDVARPARRDGGNPPLYGPHLASADQPPGETPGFEIWSRP